MDELIRQYPYKVASLISIVIAGVMWALHRLGWLRIGSRKKWDGLTERRECGQHPAMQQKVCSLYGKLEELDKKLDTVAEKLQFVLGTLEARWGKK